ncbi:flavin monoamine oxidase family protein [Flavobacterium algicola]|uniref:flavin monoamine oxidase family protein n=1 Tax=Flavobacterium algicola TaxID=556529 RepID=UPI001EFCC8AE|nr:FAD-dependent oxidoreductase [Flavobacterium algicola]MCG9792198.1 FAD-dependent oxidoreductase [Flavobacterium algicola]
MSRSSIIVIGAGLSGLATAYFLKKKRMNVLVLEANTKIGGRIQTIIGNNSATMEMGATWFGRQHPNLLAFLKEIELDYFRQHTQGISLFETMSFVPPQKFEIPDSDEPSYRLAGGTSKLIEKLANYIGLEYIKLDTRIVEITDKGSEVALKDDKGYLYLASQVVITVPPNLAINTIAYVPALPKALTELALSTHTWMGESIKFAVEYASPFWKQKQYSGALFSHVGIITEMYDHSAYDNSSFALMGFLNGSTNVLTKQARQDKVIKQLVQCYGAEAENFVTYHEKVWREDILTFCPYNDLVMAHQNNGDALYQNSFINSKLHFAGSETATENPGYMDGAIVAAQTISSKLK